MFCYIDWQATTTVEFLSHGVQNLRQSQQLCSSRFQPSCVSHTQWQIIKPTAWPPRSPDFSLLHIYLWRHLAIALWMTVRESATAPPFLKACDGPRWQVEGILTLLSKSTLFRYNPWIKCFRTHVHTNNFLGLCNSCPTFSHTFLVHPVL
jgi:hypothetical protein